MSLPEGMMQQAARGPWIGFKKCPENDLGDCRRLHCRRNPYGSVPEADWLEPIPVTTIPYTVERQARG